MIGLLGVMIVLAACGAALNGYQGKTHLLWIAIFLLCLVELVHIGVIPLGK